MFSEEFVQFVSTANLPCEWVLNRLSRDYADPLGGEARRLDGSAAAELEWEVSRRRLATLRAELNLRRPAPYATLIWQTYPWITMDWWTAVSSTSNAAGLRAAIACLS